MMRSSSAVVAAALAIALGGCSDSSGAAAPDELQITPATVALEVGESTQVTASFLRHGA